MPGNESNSKVYLSILAALLLISLIVVAFYPRQTCATFPTERDGFCADDGDYYICAIDSILSYEPMLNTYKTIGLVTINETYDSNDPPIEVYGELYIWNDGWEYWLNLIFPLDYFYGPYPPLVPCTYNNYEETEDLLYTSLENIVANLEGSPTLLNFSISHHEQFVTMTQECHPANEFYNGEYIVDAYYCGVEYILEAYIDYPPNDTIYFKAEIVSECNSGIPLLQSYILVEYTNSAVSFYGIISAKTIATSIALLEV
jgi:hypothetical protein